MKKLLFFIISLFTLTTAFSQTHPLDTNFVRQPISANPGYDYIGVSTSKSFTIKQDTTIKLAVRDSGSIAWQNGQFWQWGGHFYSALIGNVKRLTDTTFLIGIDTMKISGGSGGSGGSETLEQVIQNGPTATTTPHFDSTVTQNKLINEGLTIGDTLSTFTDSVWFVGTSITFDKNATQHSTSFAALTAAALGSVEVNKGVPGTTLAPGGSSIFNRLSDLPFYRGSIRYVFVELGTNDRPSSPSDTVAARGYYASLWDTLLLHRGWSTHKDQLILVVSPPVAVTTMAAINMQWLATMEINLAHEKGITKIADTYTYLALHGYGLNISSDSLHPNDLGHLNMKKTIMYTLGGKTNGNLLVNGPGVFNGDLSATGNLDIAGASVLHKPLTIFNPTINTNSITLYQPLYFGSNQYSQIEFKPGIGFTRLDSMQFQAIHVGSSRIGGAWSHNYHQLVAFDPTDNTLLFNEGKNTMGPLGDFTSLGPITARAYADNVPMATFISTNTAAAPGIRSSIYFKQGVGGPFDQFYLDYVVGSGYHNNFVLRANSTDIWRVNESTNAIPYEILVKTVFGGAVGFGADPDASALLDIPSTTKGVLIPRMTRSQFNSISSKATGLHVILTDSSYRMSVYDGSKIVSYVTTDMLNSAVADIDAGTYSPSLDNTTNLAASATHDLQWSRTKNMWNVFGYVEITATAANTATTFDMDLPAPGGISGFLDQGEAGGSFVSENLAPAANIAGSVSANTATGHVTFALTPSTTSGKKYRINFWFKLTPP